MTSETADMYRALGAELECTLDNDWRREFARCARERSLRFEGTSSRLPGFYLLDDVYYPLNRLGKFATFKAKAVDLRLKGEIHLALAAEQAAEGFYSDLPKDCRW